MEDDDSRCCNQRPDRNFCDASPGFAPEKADAVFEMFVRGDAESALPGTGLGLALCSAIVAAHCGAIAATNHPKGGGCVSFTLPLGEPPAIEDEELATGAEACPS